MCANQTKDIINYWSAMEQLSPYKIDNKMEKRDSFKELMTAVNAECLVENDFKYLGVYVGGALIGEILKLLPSDDQSKDKIVERYTDRTPACSFKIDNKRNYVPRSFMISPFLWAFFNMLNGIYDAVKWHNSLSLANDKVEKLICDILANRNDHVSKIYEISQMILDIILTTYEAEQAAVGSGVVADAIYGIFKDVLIDTLVGGCPKIVGNFFKAVSDKVYETIKEHFNSSKKNDVAIQELASLFSIKVTNSESFIPLYTLKVGKNDDHCGMLSGFFMNDIKKFSNLSGISKLPDGLVRYIQMQKPRKQRVDDDIEEMKRILSAENFPLGMFPSKHSPSLMQQIAINLATQHIDGNDNSTNQIFSVNGPPGTGKTSLIKEIVASNIVKRAIILKDLNPTTSFVNVKGCYDVESNGKTFPVECYSFPEGPLSRYGILIASSNNLAVENISTELPKFIKDNARTPVFNAKQNGKGYFDDIAARILGVDNAIGMLSAKLGKGENIGDFIRNFWFADKDKTVKAPNMNALNPFNSNNSDFDESSKLDWGKTVEQFEKALIQVNLCREKIKQAQKRLVAIKRVNDRCSELESTLANIELKYANLVNKRTRLFAENCLMTTKESKLISQRCDAVKSMPFYKRWFFRLFTFINDDEVLRIHDFDNELKNISCRINGNFLEINQLPREFYSLNKENIEIKLNECKRHRESLKLKIDLDIVLFRENYPDDNFWENIISNKNSQVACPWTYPDYDAAREELFYRALMLHKAFLMNCQGAWKNISFLIDLWKGKKEAVGLRNAVYPHLLNTLLLFVPVISTTFASVQSFLSGIKGNELGTLIIDEAGQALPYAALGALWRTQKAVVVGDPLQIEPVVSVPDWLLTQIAAKMNITEPYVSTKLSVQAFADAINPYIGKLNDTEVGCPLVVHRRCNNPMFAISNSIAYGNRMIYQSNDCSYGTKFVFGDSKWYDCGGIEKVKGDHTVVDQVNYVADQLLPTMQDGNKIFDYPDVFIISPFKTVSSSIRKELRAKFKIQCKKNRHCNYSCNDKCSVWNEFNKWIESHCGTVHTFQGKEANEVVLVLGCDSSAQGAMDWVVSSPNILNVAISRAKYRLTVVGEWDIWKDKNYMDLIRTKLTDFATDYQ